MKGNLDYSGHRTRAFQLAVVLLVSARWLFPSPTSAPDQEQAPASTRLVTQEELVKELEKEFAPMPADCKKPIVRSPDNLRVACAAKREKKWVLYVNGVPGPEYDQLSPDGVVFSPDSKHLAYPAAKDKNTEVMVVDGAEQAPFHLVGLPMFSPDSKRLAYGAEKDKNTRVVLVDGVEQRYSPVGNLVFSPDSKHLAYVAAKDENTEVMVVDGAEQAPFYLVGRPEFSRDSKHLAYVAGKDENTWVVVVDGAEQTPYQRVADPFSSPDGKNLGWYAEKGKKTVVVFVDGVVQPYTPFGDLVFSPDSQHLAYAARKDKNTQVMVLDGAQQAPFHHVWRPRFSPDSKRLAYSAAKDKNTEVMVVDGAEQTPYQRVTDPVFSPDSKRLAYFAAKDKKTSVVVVDGVEQPYSPGGDLVFSPDSQHLAYTAVLASGWNDKIALVVDGKVRSPEYSSLTKLRFSPDSKRLAYVGCKKDCEAVIDDKQGQASGWVGPVSFSEDSRHYAYAAAHFGIRHNPMVMVSNDQVWPVEYGNVIIKRALNGLDQLGEKLLPSPEAAKLAGALLYPLIGAQGKLVAWIEMENPFRPGWERVVVNGRRGPDSKSIFTEKEHETSVEMGFLTLPEEEIEKRVAAGLFRPVPGLSPDGEHLAYVRRFSVRGRDKESVVLDEQEGKPYDAVGRPQFTGNNTVSFTAIDGRKVFHVTQSIQ